MNKSFYYNPKSVSNNYFIRKLLSSLSIDDGNKALQVSLLITPLLSSIDSLSIYNFIECIFILYDQYVTIFVMLIGRKSAFLALLGILTFLTFPFMSSIKAYKSIFFTPSGTTTSLSVPV